MSEGSERDALESALKEATGRVRILGTVPFDLDWESIVQSWARAAGDNSGREINVLCESDNALFMRALTSDLPSAEPRMSYRDLRVIRDRALEVPTLYREFTEAAGQNTTFPGAVRIMHLPMPLAVVDVDGDRFVCLTLADATAPVERVKPGDPLWEETTRYMEVYFSPDSGGRYAAEDGTELLELFDHEGVPRGIFPRNSFYDTDYTQLVVWALIFDRQGRLLIHRRSDNAKDNRGMWDKSVGGHVDPSEHADTSHGALREVIEELFTDELDAARGFRPFQVTDDDVVYLGEWRSEVRGRYMFKEAAHYDKRWFFVRLRNRPRVYTPRLMPDGSSRRLRVRADVFFFVAGDVLTEDKLGSLKNSAYKLVEVTDLKSVMDAAMSGTPVPGFDPTGDVPQFSPDLVNIMTGELRDELQEFAQMVKRYINAHR